MSYVIIRGGSAHDPFYFHRDNPSPQRDPSSATIFSSYELAAAEQVEGGKIVPFAGEWSWYRMKSCAACQ